MRRILTLLIMSFFITVSYGQDIVEKTYKHVISEGFSTGPDFVVVTIENKENQKSKEVCVDVASLYWSLQQEYNQDDFNSIGDSLLAHSENRTFKFENSEALERLFFKQYNNKEVELIKTIIEKESLIDSLKKLNHYRQIHFDEYYPYVEIRNKKIEQIRDSIKSERKLTIEESEILDRLDEPYYDYHYNEWYWNKLSNQGQVLVLLWNKAIKNDKIRYDSIEKEKDRMEKKFFFNYYDEYGTQYCHALFYFGVTCYQDCENGQIKFGEIIKEN